MAHRFVIADVFTDRPFAGNQLAVFPDAQAVPERAMQAIAREFNFPETTFVLPAREAGHAARVRIFTPKAELPFAGHPTVGTAAVLAQRAQMALPGVMILEEGIGPVRVEVARRGALVHAQLVLEREVERPQARPERASAAAALQLPEAQVLEAWFAGAGVPFCFVRLSDRAAVDRAVLDRAAWAAHFARAWAPNLYLFCGEDAPYARMFAPALGIDEDPATGAAAVALAGVLAARRPESEGHFAWTIDQGVAMGRPSRIEAAAHKRSGKLVQIKVGGTTVISAEGTLTEASGS